MARQNYIFHSNGKVVCVNLRWDKGLKVPVRVRWLGVAKLRRLRLGHRAISIDRLGLYPSMWV